MKKLKIITITILTLFLFSCEKTEDVNVNTIEGKYKGTITVESYLKSNSNIELMNFPANVDVTISGNMQIEVHCYGQDLDSTFMLNYFEHHDSIMVCLTGDDFEHMYGHKYGEGHMTGSMGHSLQNGETEWMHHISDEHVEGDEHFGGFDLIHRSFDYTIKINDLEYHFKGTK